MTGTATLEGDTLFVPVLSLEVINASFPGYACCPFRGSVVAYDAITGHMQWPTHAVTEEPTRRGVTSVGTERLGPSGAPVWNSPAVDAARGQILFGTGENYSSPATGASDAISAVDMESGAVNRVYQATVGDARNRACSFGIKGPNCPEEDGPDLDFGAGATIATTSRGRDLRYRGAKIRQRIRDKLRQRRTRVEDQNRTRRSRSPTCQASREIAVRSAGVQLLSFTATPSMSARGMASPV